MSQDDKKKKQMQQLHSIINGSEEKMARQKKYEDLRELVADLKKNGDCLEWKYGTHSQGYPMTRWNGNMQQVARLLMEEHIGEKLYRTRRVKRTCGNEKCCNIEHLYIAEPGTEEWKCIGKTIKDETRQAIRNEIKNEPYYWGKNTRVAEKYGIGISTLYAILKEKT